VPENGHATANMAVPRWQLDLQNTPSACYLSTIQQVRQVQKRPEFWYSLCILPHCKVFALARIQRRARFGIKP
jgi:hypothetical protein